MSMLTGKIALVTGATSGIGRRTVERFVEEGAQVLFCGRRMELGASLEKALGSDRCRFMKADVTQEADVARLIAGCLENWGRIDCLFNNAGGPAPQGGIESIPVEGFDAAMATLVRSVMLGMKHAAPVMVKQGAGSIINNGSVAAVRAGLSSSMVYSAAKAAVVHLSNCVAMQLGEKNVRVNCISPGGIATGIFGKAFGLPAEAADKTAEAIKAGLAKLQPIPRRHHRRHRQRRGVPRLGPIELHQRTQSSGGRWPGGRARMVGAASRACRNEAGIRKHLIITG